MTEYLFLNELGWTFNWREYRRFFWNWGTKRKLWRQIFEPWLLEFFNPDKGRHFLWDARMECHIISPSGINRIVCVPVSLCGFYWGSSLCTFALKQMDFNWRDQTLSVTKRRNIVNIISKLKPQTIQHITLIISLSLSHTHSSER